MFKIHTKDGQTARVDFSDESQAKMWLERLKDPTFQETITAISVVQECTGRFKCPTCKRVAKLQCSRCKQPASEVHCGTGTQYTISKPAGFRDIFYHVELLKPDKKHRIKGGEKVTCFVDDVRLTAMIHSSQSSRITLLHTGKQRYNPFKEGK